MHRSRGALTKKTKAAVAVAFVLTGCTIARAADLLEKPIDVRQPVAVMPAFSWTGFYLGVDIGGMQAKPAFTPGGAIAGAPFVATSLPVNEKYGLAYGLVVGVNYQIDNVVLGLEGDVTGWTVGNLRYTAPTGDFITAHSTWGGSIRPRLGYAAGQTLFYLTGGAAFASDSTTVTTTGISVGPDGIRWGWTVGAGIERVFLRHWLVGLSYRYTQYVSRTISPGVTNLGIVNFSDELSDHRLMIRTGYKF